MRALGLEALMKTRDDVYVMNVRYERKCNVMYTQMRLRCTIDFVRESSLLLLPRHLLLKALHTAVVERDTTQTPSENHVRIHIDTMNEGRSENS